MIILKISDFKCVGLVAQHCDLNKICIAENEAISQDFYGLYCGYAFDIEEIITEVDTYLEALAACEADPDCTAPPEQPLYYENKFKLVYGGVFESVCGRRIMFNGVKTILVYYSYARYIMINGINDTPTGHVHKTNEYSMPLSVSELEVFSNKYRNMGYSAYENSKNFVCYSGLIENFPCENKCFCGSKECGGKTKNKGFGFKTQIITKNGMRKT